MNVECFEKNLAKETIIVRHDSFTASIPPTFEKHNPTSQLFPNLVIAVFMGASDKCPLRDCFHRLCFLSYASSSSTVIFHEV